MLLLPLLQRPVVEADTVCQVALGEQPRCCGLPLVQLPRLAVLLLLLLLLHEGMLLSLLLLKVLRRRLLLLLLMGTVLR